MEDTNVEDEKFFESYPDINQIILKTTEGHQQESHIKKGWGYGHIVNSITEQGAKNQLIKDMVNNEVLKKAWDFSKKQFTDDKLKELEKPFQSNPDWIYAVYAYTLPKPSRYLANKEEMGEALYVDFNSATRQLTHSFTLVDYKYIGLYQMLFQAVNSEAAFHKKPVTVYRGCQDHFITKKGDKITFLQFTSTTEDRGQTNFAFSDKKKITLFIIETTRALKLERLSYFPKQKELLLAPNSEFEVQEVKDVKKTIKYRKKAIEREVREIKLKETGRSSVIH